MDKGGNVTIASPDAFQTGLTTSFADAGVHTFSVSVRVTYWPGTGEVTYAGNATVTLKQMVAQKVWSAGSAIGKKLDANGDVRKDPNKPTVDLEDGRITAPQDQRPKPVKPDGTYPTPALVRVGPGAKINCAIEAATDQDHWVKDFGDPAYDKKGDEADDIKSYTWTCSGGKFYLGNDADGTPKLEDTVTGQTATWWAWTSPGDVTLTCTIEDEPKAVVAPDAPVDVPNQKRVRGDAPLKRTVTVTVLPATIEVKRRNSGNEWASSARVAAGGMASGEHHGSVRLVLGGDPTLRNLPVGDLKIAPNTGKGYLGSDATLTMTSQFVGDFKSSNLINQITPLRLEAGAGSVQSNSFSNVWDDVTDAEHWKHEPYFSYGEGAPITFMPKFTHEQPDKNAVRIRGQQIFFTPTKINVWLWNGEISDWKLSPFQQGMTQWDVIKGLANFSPTQVSDGGTGEYTTSLAVTYDEKRVVDSVDFDAVGKSVFE